MFLNQIFQRNPSLSSADGSRIVIKIGDSKSDPHQLLSGVPQGSVAGPQIFTLYSSPIEDIVKHYPV